MITLSASCPAPTTSMDGKLMLNFVLPAGLLPNPGSVARLGMSASHNSDGGDTVSLLADWKHSGFGLEGLGSYHCYFMAPSGTMAPPSGSVVALHLG